MTTKGLLAIRRGITYDELQGLIGAPICYTIEQHQHCLGVPTSLSADIRHSPDGTLSYSRGFAGIVDPDVSIYVRLQRGVVIGPADIKVDDTGICCADGLPTSPFYGGGSRDILAKRLGR